MPSVLFRPYPTPTTDSVRNANNGFDDTNGRPWQMVPAGGEKLIKFVVIGPGSETWRVEPVNHLIKSVVPADPTRKQPLLQNVYRIGAGSMPGNSAVVVRGSRGGQWGRLDIGIKSLRTVHVNFFLVSDKAGRKTTTTESDVKEWVDYANKNIFLPQINVRFGTVSVKPLEMHEDLGDPVDFGSIGLIPVVPMRTDAEKRWHRITARGELRPETFNVFCLWDFITKGEEPFSAFVCAKTGSASDMEKSKLMFNMCMMKGRKDLIVPGRAPLIFAHEAGHYLEGKAFHYENAGDDFFPLMRDDGLGGERLLRRDADAMNR